MRFGEGKMALERPMLRPSAAICAMILLFICSSLVACGNGSASSPNSAFPQPTTMITAVQNPLVAQYSVSAPYAGEVMVDFGMDTNYGRQTAWYALPAQGGTVNIQVAGMRASTTYHMRAHLVTRSTTWIDQDQVFTTGSLPSISFPTLTVTRPVSSLASTEGHGIEMLTLTTGNFQSYIIQAFFTDRDANPIWYYDVGQGNIPSTLKLLPNGHIILSIYEPVAGNFVLREVDLAGNTIREMTVAQLNQKLQQAGINFVAASFHHDILTLQNGHLILLVNSTKDFTNLPDYPGVTSVLGDDLVELDTNWNPVWTWSAFDHLDVNRHLEGLPDWTHSNAVIYLPQDHDLLISMRLQAWILKIDYKDGSGTGSVLWKLGNEGDFSLAGGNPSQWFYFQHYPKLISENSPQMTLAVFDNGNNRVLDNSGTVCGTAGNPDCYSRATIFQVDESTRTAALVWDFLPGFYSFWGGSINQLENGNVEFDMSQPIQSLGQGVLSRVTEVSQTPAPEIVWQMDISGAFAYRAYRVPSLYPEVSWSY
jgi:arylsulfate sulfotransferase